MRNIIIVIGILVVLIGVFIWQGTRQFELPEGETEIKHSIPIGEILSGGVGKDGIPSIDNPKFISTKEADSF